MPAVGRAVREHRVVGVRAADVRGAGLDARRVVRDAEDHRLEPVGPCAGDRLDVRHAPRGLDQDVDPDPSRLPAVALLDLVQQGCDELDVARGADLRDEHGVEDLAPSLDDVDDVAVAPVGVEAVDPDADRGPGPVVGTERLDHVRARLLLVVGRDRVLEVEEHQVGAERRGLLHRPEVRPGDGELAAVEACLVGHRATVTGGRRRRQPPDRRSARVAVTPIRPTRRIGAVPAHRPRSDGSRERSFGRRMSVLRRRSQQRRMPRGRAAVVVNGTSGTGSASRSLPAWATSCGGSTARS